MCGSWIRGKNTDPVYKDPEYGSNTDPDPQQWNTHILISSK